MTWRDFQRKQRVLEIGDRFISYVDEGSGPILLLLHGMPTWGYVWSPILPALSQRARLIIPDLPGFGFSDKSDCFDRSIDRQVEWIDQFLLKLGISRVTVIGHDLGGGVAMGLALSRPERVERLCLLDSVCYDSWPTDIMQGLGRPEGYRRLSSRRIGMLLKRGMKKGFSALPREEFLSGLLAPYGTEIGKLSLIRNAVALNTNLTMEMTPLLQKLRLPCLVLWGENDPFQPVSYGQRLSKDIFGAEFVTIAGARHFVMEDKPAELAACLLQFLGPSGRVAVPSHEKPRVPSPGPEQPAPELRLAREA